MLVALAVLLQALFVVPMAVRMAADTLWAARLGTPLCTDGSHDGGTGQAPASPHGHDQCLICHGSAMPFGTLAAAAILLALVSRCVLVARVAVPALPRPRGRCTPYRSRAPPAFTFA